MVNNADDVGAMWSVGVNGATVATAAASIGSTLAAMPSGGWDTFLLNWGANDVGGPLPSEATWQSDYLAILDAIHAAYPFARVYIMRPWRSGFDANAATLKARIDNIVAARSSFAFVGPDEAVWLKGADNGATMTTDGTHYSTAGKAECAAQWKAALGY